MSQIKEVTIKEALTFLTIVLQCGSLAAVLIAAKYPIGGLIIWGLLTVYSLRWLKIFPQLWKDFSAFSTTYATALAAQAVSEQALNLLSHTERLKDFLLATSKNSTEMMSTIEAEYGIVPLQTTEGDAE